MKYSNGPISRRTSASLGVDHARSASAPSRSLICLEIEPLRIQGFFRSLLAKNEWQTPLQYLPFLLFLIPLALIIPAETSCLATAEPIRVARIQFKQRINAASRHQLLSQLRTAEKREMKAVILEVDSTGGRIDFTIDLCRSIQKLSIPVVSFITGKAEGAAALLALSADRLYMMPGTKLGTTEPMVGGQALTYGPGRMVDALVETFVPIGTSSGTPEAIIKGLIDPSLSIRWIEANGKTKFVTLDELEQRKHTYRNVKVLSAISESGTWFQMVSGDARRYGLCRRELKNSYEVAKQETEDWTAQPQLHTLRADRLDSFISFFNNRYITGLFLLLGVTALFLELNAPGAGVFGSTGLLFCGFPLFWSGLIGLAAPLEITLFLMGGLLFLIEVFLNPRLGFSGIAGIICIIGSSIFFRQNFLMPETVQAPWELEYMFDHFVLSLTSLGGGLLCFLMLLQYVPSSFYHEKLILVPTDQKSVDGRDLKDTTITIQQPLRPHGTVLIRGKPAPAVSNGRFFEQGEKWQVIGVNDNELTVRPL